MILREDGWRKLPNPQLQEQWDQMMAADPNAPGMDQVKVPETWVNDDGRVAFVGFEWAGGRPMENRPRWHISCRHASEQRVLDWAELAQTAHELRPGVAFAVGIPPRNLWLNLHPDVLHLWEVRDEPILEEFRVNARGDRPT